MNFSFPPSILPTLPILDNCSERPFEAIGYSYNPDPLPGQPIAPVERRILGRTYSYSQAARLASLWRTAAPTNRALVLIPPSGSDPWAHPDGREA